MHLCDNMQFLTHAIKIASKCTLVAPCGVACDTISIACFKNCTLCGGHYIINIPIVTFITFLPWLRFVIVNSCSSPRCPGDRDGLSELHPSGPALRTNQCCTHHTSRDYIRSRGGTANDSIGKLKFNFKYNY